MGSSVLGSTGEGNQSVVSEEVVEEGEAEIKVDATGEWANVAPHEIGLYAPFYITSASLEYLVSQVGILASTRDAESVEILVKLVGYVVLGFVGYVHL